MFVFFFLVSLELVSSGGPSESEPESKTLLLKTYSCPPVFYVLIVFV